MVLFICFKIHKSHLQNILKINSINILKNDIIRIHHRKFILGGVKIMIKIRHMEEKDIRAIQEIAINTWHATYEGIIPLEVQNNFLKVAYNESRLNTRINNSLFLVAERDGILIGFANFSNSKENGKAELVAIYINPTSQGNGVGTLLIQHAINKLQGVKEIFVCVEKDNTIGRTFYQSKGFETIEEFDDNFDGHILKTVRMLYQVK